MKRKLKPDDLIPGLSGTHVNDFWAWAYSDVLANTIRSAYAEFLVAVALGLTSEPRTEWDSVDLRYEDRSIEVKSSAYLQTWRQSKPSQIRFDIAKKLGWDARTNETAADPKRSADCYVFCLHPEIEPARMNVLDADAWEFFVIGTEDLTETFGDQKTLGLSPLRRIVSPSGFSGLKERIDSVLGVASAA